MSASTAPNRFRTAQVAAGIAAGGFGALGAFLAVTSAKDGDVNGALAGTAIVVGAVCLGFIFPAVLGALASAAENTRKLSDIQEHLASATGSEPLEDRLAQIQEKLTAIQQWTWLSDDAKKALARPVELERFRRAVEELASREEHDEALRLIDMLEEHCGLPHEANQLRVRVEDRKFRAVDGQARSQINLVRKLINEDNFIEAERQVNAFRKAFVGDPRSEELERTVQRARRRRYEALRGEWDRSVETFNLDSCQLLIKKLRQVAEPAELPELEDALQRVDQATQRALKERFSKQVHQRQWSAAIETGVEILSRYPHSTMAGEFRDVRGHLMERVRSEPTRLPPDSAPDADQADSPARSKDADAPESTG